MAPTEVLTPVFRLGFPHLFVPHKANAKADEKYSACLLFPPGTDLTEMAAAATQAAFDKWGDNLPHGLKSPWHLGQDKRNKKGERMVGFEDGVIYTTASTNQRPGVVDEQVQAIIDQGVIYPGCYCRAKVNAFWYDNQSVGVSFGLNNIQKMRDGEPFSGRSAPEDDFTPVPVDPNAVQGQAPAPANTAVAGATGAPNLGLPTAGPAAAVSTGIGLPTDPPA